MSDTAEQAALSGKAPTDERVDALTELQKAHMPTGTDMRDMDAFQEVVEQLRDQFEFEQSLIKANPNIVPFPSKRSKEDARGMHSVAVDDWQITLNGDYWERPAALSFDSLRMMVEQTPVLNAVVMTRVRQMQRFARVAEDRAEAPGFEIRHIDASHQITDEERRSMSLLQRFFLNCGWEFSPRKRKRLRRDSFSQFIAKVARDSLILDSVGIETEWKRDKSLGLDGFYAVDGATIRLCSEQGYQGDDEIYALQVVNGRITTAYTFDDLIYEARNPRTDVNASGYGLPETELLVRVVTGFLNAMTYNIKGFDQNAIPKGILHLSGNYSQADLEAFKRYWNAMVKGVNNAWTLPVLVSKDQESRAQFDRLGVEFDEMYFAKWMTFLTSIICAIYGMSPAEINFDSFTGGNTSALSGSDTAEKLAASRDSGLRPLLSYFENLFSDYIAQEFSDKYVFRWTGLDPQDEQQRWEARKMILTVNEMRAEEGYGAIEGPLGEAPVNPSLQGVWMQMQAGQQDQGQGPMPGDADSGDREASDSEGPRPGGEPDMVRRLNQTPEQVAAGSRKKAEELPLWGEDVAKSLTIYDVLS